MKQKAKIRILLVEDHPLYRVGLLFHGHVRDFNGVALRKRNLQGLLKRELQSP